MKSFSRLITKSIWSIIGIALFFLVLFLIVFFLGSYESVEELIGVALIFLLFFAVAFVVLLVYIAIILASYERAKKVLRGIPGFSEERFGREVVRYPQMQNLLACSDAISFYNSYYIVRTIALKDIIWAYQEQSTKIVGISVYTRSGEHISIPIMMKRKHGRVDAAGRYLLRLIARKNKGIQIGYNENAEKLFHKDFGRFMREIPYAEVVHSAVLEQEYIQNDYYTKDFV